MASNVVTTPTTGRNQRRAMRYKCQGSAEVLIQPGGSVQQWATVTDISRIGCYIETAAPLPLGQSACLRLTMCDCTICLDGKVVVVHPMFGMGIEFTAVPPDQQSILDALLARLAGSSETPPPPAPAVQPQKRYRMSGETAVALLAQISKHLAQKRVLTHEEFIGFLEKVK